MNTKFLSIVLLFAAACTTPSISQEPEAANTSHPLSFLFGEWRGEASGVHRNQEAYSLIQTERVGPMLGGDVIVIEGRGYEASGDLSFNAFAIVSENKRTGAYEIKSYTNGGSGVFPFEPRDNGFSWSVAAGPGAKIRYTAIVEGDQWNQVGEYVADDADPVQIFEMSLRRIGDSDWPAGGAVTP